MGEATEEGELGTQDILVFFFFYVEIYKQNFLGWGKVLFVGRMLSSHLSISLRITTIK